MSTNKQITEKRMSAFAYLPRTSRGRAGFSLVELAIVLVIIGLILSSVLVGQDIIRAAELRAITKQFNDYRTAVQTFATRFDNSLPGDITSASAVGFGMTVNACNGADGEGDGDGLIESDGGGRDTFNGEVSCFWQHLGDQNMVQGTYDGWNDGVTGTGGNDVIGLNLPEVRGRATGWGAYNDGIDNYMVAGVLGNEDDDDYHTSGTFRPQDARDIDSKIDDGIPTSGSVLGRDDCSAAGGSGTACADNDGDPHYVEAAPDTDTTPNCMDVGEATLAANVDLTDDVYDGTFEQPLCVLSFKLPRI